MDLSQLDPTKLTALASKFGIGQDKVLSIAKAMLPTIKDKLGGLMGGGDTALFGDLLKDQQFKKMFDSPELQAATAAAAKDTGVDASKIASMLPELGKLL
jgi:hypothetical protein